MKTIFIFFSALFLTTFSQAQIRYLKANLQGSQQVPANGSAGIGVVIVKYNTATKFLQLWGNYQNVSAAITASHIHSPGAPGTNANVLITLANTGGTSGTLSGTATLTAGQETDLLSGLMYVNVHNVNFSGGEIRGQLSPATDGQTELFNGRLQGAQEVPPNASTATGTVNVLIDKTTDSVWVTGSYAGLVANASAAHIHSAAAPGATAPVAITLNSTPATSGTLDIASPITAGVKAAMLSGTTYINVHNSTFSGGEIRAQLFSASSLRYFAGALVGTQEVPSNASAARGTVIVRYNTLTKLLELWGDYQALTDPVTGSHIHSPGAPGATGGVIISLTNTGGTMGTLTGSATLTTTQETELLSGLMYANVHSTTYPNGEIRAQLLAQSAGETQYLTGNMQASQSVATPAVVSSGVGSATVLLDKVTRNIYVTGSYSGLTSGITNTHIHRGAAGSNGVVSIQLQFVAGTTSGTVTGSALGITQTLTDSIINGFSYLNVHSANYTAGEIRAQLGNLVLPVLLRYFNGYKDQNKISLIWETEQQSNLDRYEIEQQNPITGEWISKSTIAATGGAASIKLKFTDLPASFNSTYVIYRLKMIDKDGKFYYSPSVKINYRESKAELVILGNPVLKGELTYMLTGLAIDHKTEVSVIDYNGRIVLRTVGQALMNNKLNVAKLSSGMYKLVVKLDDTTLQQNFMK